MVDRGRRGLSARRGSVAAALALATALVAVVAGGPSLMIAIGKRRASACFEAIEAPRGAALPDCGREARWFELPSRVPWTRRAATARAEELRVRLASAAYVDAAVGAPDRAQLDHATGDMENAERLVAGGTRRIRYEDLGPPTAAPRLGREASRIGDLRTLVQLAERWDDWYVRLAALRAALAEGDTASAVRIAARYADFDPRDEDLRVAVAALLCLGEQPRRGVEMLTFTQNDRATRRYAGMSRGWGDARALIVACAALARAEPPPRPDRAEGGDDDRVEVRVAQAARLAAAAGDRRRALDAARTARDLLASSVGAPEARIGLLATALAEEGALDAMELLELLRPREASGEAALSFGPLPSPALFPAPGLLWPVVSGPRLAAAADRAAALSADPALGEADRAAIRGAAAALAFEAARELALAGDAAAAVLVLDRRGEAAGEAALALGRASAWQLAGDPGRALDALGEPPRFAGEPAATRVAAALTRAELLAELGRRAEAARAAVEADDAATEVAVPSLVARARWTRLWLARPPHAEPLRGGPERVPATVPRRTDGDRLYPWPWVGFADPAAPWARPGQRDFDLALARWDAARAASPEERRALRFAALRRRGDVPPALTAYLAVAAELLPEGEGDTELWLDALLAADARRFTFREMAFARAVAARFRGDAASAAVWRRRYEALRAVASDPDRAEIARQLGI